MTGLVASASTSTTAATSLPNDGWWPDIDLGALRNASKLDGTVPDERLRAMAVAAVLDANAQLQSWQDTQRAAGMANAASVPGPSIDGITATVQHYVAAVRALVQAAAAESYRDFDTTAAGDKKADAIAPSVDAFRRNAAWSIRAVQGLPHSCVELI